MLPRLRFREGKLAFDAEPSEQEARVEEAKRMEEEAQRFLQEVLMKGNMRLLFLGGTGLAAFLEDSLRV